MNAGRIRYSNKHACKENQSRILVEQYSDGRVSIGLLISMVCFMELSFARFVDRIYMKLVNKKEVYGYGKK